MTISASGILDAARRSAQTGRTIHLADEVAAKH